MDLNLSDYIKHPEKLDKETLPRLEKLVGDYPYFQPARLLYLRNLYLLHDAAFDRELRLIDNFLANLPEEKPHRPKPVDASTDYMAYLMQSEDAPDTITAVPRMQHQELIDEFIGQGDKRIVLNQDADSELQTPALPAEGENEEDEDYFTETLAKIYIKQGRYTKAMEIIRRLSLKYPKKNRYFADQIRFLEKLIINNKNKKS